MKNFKLKIKNYFLIFVLLFSFFGLFYFNYCKASILYLENKEQNYFQKDNFLISVKINTEKECINAVSVNLKFNEKLLTLKDISKGSSIISLWLEEPEFSNENGSIHFSGGIPGGYCGAVSGDLGETDLLLKLIFEVRENFQNESSAEISFSEGSEVFLNDGLGSKANLTLNKSSLILFPELSEKTKQEWLEELEKDKNPPLPFEIKTIEDPLSKKYFITYFSVDKETGLDYYEIKEGNNDWIKTTNSTYLLKDQKLKSVIEIKAFDKAGNYRIVKYNPVYQEKNQPLNIQKIIIFSFVLLLIFLFIFWALKRFVL